MTNLIFTVWCIRTAIGRFGSQP